MAYFIDAVNIPAPAKFSPDPILTTRQDFRHYTENFCVTQELVRYDAHFITYTH